MLCPADTNEKIQVFQLGFFGLPERIRTFDLQSRSLTRYPAVPRVDIFLRQTNTPLGLCLFAAFYYITLSARLQAFFGEFFPLFQKNSPALIANAWSWARFCAHMSDRSASSGRGSVTVKVLPCPFVLCTAMLPPHRVAARCAMVSPMPYPLL